MGSSIPYMYGAEQRSSSRFPEKPFDPKAVTRASWEPKPKKPKQEGPYVSFGRHPDAQMVLTYRANNFVSMGPRTKAAIKWLRWVQLALRLVQLNAALGLLVLMIMFTHVATVTHWVLRVAPGVIAVLCCYGIYHHSRDASGRTPGNSAAYQIFAGLTDLGVLGVYGFGAFITHRDSEAWATRLKDQQLMDIFVPTVYYTFIGSGGLHLISLSISFWLGYAFRQITLMPPDMNPLEDNLTARPLHKRNKSSVATFSTMDEKRSSVAASSRHSVMSQDAFPNSNRNSVPFMHTRTESRDSFARSSRSDLPERHYQIMPGNSARNSAISLESKRMSAYGSSQRGSYAEIPLSDPSAIHEDDAPPSPGYGRQPKFIETWMPTDSLISRTNQRNREMAAAKTGSQARASKSYASLNQRYDVADSDSEGDENDMGSMLPNPLRLNPATPPAQSTTPRRAKTPFYASAAESLSEISPNQRRVSASRDITDQKPDLAPPGYQQHQQHPALRPADNFYSRPYGELKSATPPVMVGTDRKVSSGNDYDSKRASMPYGRRNVSGKVAEEGRGGTGRFSRYDLRER